MNLFAKVINMTTKVNSNLCQTSEMELFPQVATDYRGKFRILKNILDEAFCNNSYKQSHYNFCYSANMLNNRSRGFDCVQYCIA